MGCCCSMSCRHGVKHANSPGKENCLSAFRCKSSAGLPPLVRGTARRTPRALLSTAPGQCRARERPPLSLTRTHQGTASSSNTRASARSAVFDVRGNTNTWVERGGHDRAAAPAGSCWPAAALRSSPLLGEYLSGSLCAGERAQVMYHRPHWPGALRHRTLTVRRRRVLMLRITGPTFAQRRKLRASAL